jgi:hypothetical protein
MPNPHQSESNKDRTTLDLEPTVIQTAADSSNDPSEMTQAESDNLGIDGFNGVSSNIW